MNAGQRDLAVMLRTLQPQFGVTAFEFVTKERASADELATAMAVVREAEGITLVRPTSPRDDAMACITLTVHSSLEAVGLTAAVAGALAEHHIACNVVAGFFHDHVFVPWPDRDAAMSALRALAAS